MAEQKKFEFDAATRKLVISYTWKLFIICAVTAVCLALANMITAEPIADARAAKEQNAMQLVMADADTFEALELQNGYASVTAVSKAVKAGETCGYVLQTTSSGFGGAMSIIVGIDCEGAITGVSVVSNNETPGLGEKATLADYLERYIGKSGSLSVIKNGTAGESEIVAATGATRSSRAVAAGVNAATEYYEDVLAGGAN